MVFHFAEAKQKWRKVQRSRQAHFLCALSPDPLLPDRFALCCLRASLKGERTRRLYGNITTDFTTVTASIIHLLTPCVSWVASPDIYIHVRPPNLLSIDSRLVLWHTPNSRTVTLLWTCPFPLYIAPLFLADLWCHHFPHLQNTNMRISLKQNKIF